METHRKTPTIQLVGHLVVQRYVNERRKNKKQKNQLHIGYYALCTHTHTHIANLNTSTRGTHGNCTCLPYQSLHSDLNRNDSSCNLTLFLSLSIFATANQSFRCLDYLRNVSSGTARIHLHTHCLYHFDV